MDKEKVVVIEGLERKTSENIFSRFSIKKLSIADKVLLCLAVLVMVSVAIYCFTGANLDFNSDVATGNILAEEIVRTHQYFPETWNCGQDLWVFTRHTFIALFTLFSDDYLLMKSAANMTLIAMSVLSCVYCSRKTAKSNMWLIAVPLIFCGISPDYTHNVLAQGSYTLQITYIFFFIAMFIDCVDKKNLKIKSWGKFIVLLLLMAFIGFGGIRGVQIYGLPLMGTIILFYYFNNRRSSILDFLKDSKNALIALVGVAVAIALGYAGFKYLCTIVNFSAVASNILFSDFDIFTRIKTFINLFINLFGISYGVPLMSGTGIVNLIKISGGILLLIVFPALQIRDYKKETSAMQLFTIFAVLHILEIFILCIFGQVLSDSSRYLFTSEFLLLFLSAHYIYKRFIGKGEDVIKLTAVLALSLYVLPSAYPKLISCVGYKEAIAAQRGLTDYLLENGLTYGYASYWNASNNTCLSNGKVEINNIIVYDRVVPYYWLNSTDRYSANSGRCFLMLNETENENFLKSYSYEEFGTAEEILKYGEFTIYVYDYNIAENNFAGIITIENEIDAYCSAYSTDSVYYYDSNTSKFGQFSDHVLYSDAAMCENGQLIVSQTELTSVTPFITRSIEQVGKCGGYFIYYSDDNVVDCTNGLPQNEETISRDYLYTEGVANQCVLVDGSYITSANGGVAFYGPYAPTVEGEYKFTISYEYIENNKIDSNDIFDVCIDTGSVILGEILLDPQENEASLTVKFSEGHFFEYRLHNESNSRIRIDYIEMQKVL